MLVGDCKFFKKSMNPVILIEQLINPKGAWTVERIHGVSKGKRMMVNESSLIGINQVIAEELSGESLTEEEHALEVMGLVKKYNWPVYIDPDAGDQIAEPGVCSVTVKNYGYWLGTFNSSKQAVEFCKNNSLNLEVEPE